MASPLGTSLRQSNTPTHATPQVLAQQQTAPPRRPSTLPLGYRKANDCGFTLTKEDKPHAPGGRGQRPGA